MDKKYIRGNTERSSEVLELLQKEFGYNKKDCWRVTGAGNGVYVKDSKDHVIFISETLPFYQIIIDLFEEIELPKIFKPEEVIFITAPATNKCNGCIFDTDENICNMERIVKSNCFKEKIIYKLKN